MKGIPAELHHETLNRVLQKMPVPASLVFINIFGTQQYPSDRIRWLLEYGTAGLTPFVAPGAPAPVMGDDGMYGEGSAAAAYWKEKAFIDETQLNNLREPLSPMEKQSAQRQIARQQRRLKTRCDRRREWMLAKAFFDHEISYQREGGTAFTVDYGVPDRNAQTLTTTDRWDTGDGSPGSSATPIQDIYDIKKDFVTDVGVNPTDFFINSETLKVLLFNSDLQDLLKSSAFGNGDLFARPAQVLGTLLGIGQLTVYDDLYEIGAWLSSDLTLAADTSAQTISVDDATDFEEGETVRIYDYTTPYTYREATIDTDGVSIPNNTIDVTTSADGNGNTTYKAGRARVVMRKKFIQDNKVGIFAREVDGESIAEFMEAPFGNQGRYGMYADSKEEWDPEGIWMRVQNKGLPVIYHPECLYTLTVG